MIATREFMIRMFPVYNARIFDGVLPTPVFRITSAGSYRGQYRREVRGVLPMRRTLHTITLSNRYDLKETELEDVLLHEMLHMYIAVKHIRDNAPHGKVFRSMMADINVRHGRNLVVSHTQKMDDDPPLNTSLPLKAYLICVCNMTDGRSLMARVAHSRVHEIHRKIANWDAVSGENWYASTELAFAAYPAIRTLKLYKISEGAQSALHSRATREMEFVSTSKGNVLRLKGSQQ